TRPDEDGTRGYGVVVTRDLATPKSSAEVRGSVIEGSHEVGIAIQGSDVTVDKTVVRATAANASGERGIGIGAQDGGDRSTLTVSSSLIEGSEDSGIRVTSSDATVDSTWVRGVGAPTKANYGIGV